MLNRHLLIVPEALVSSQATSEPLGLAEASRQQQFWTVFAVDSSAGLAACEFNQKRLVAHPPTIGRLPKPFPHDPAVGLDPEQQEFSIAKESGRAKTAC